ncbi:carboxymuconolactone decarboxylase family protein [Priestia megaterium]
MEKVLFLKRKAVNRVRNQRSSSRRVLYDLSYKGCIDQGATEQEILEACGVSAAFGGGAAMSQSVTLVQECISELTSHTH